jgi:hypothetical protein
MHNEFWVGATAAMNAVDIDVSPIIIIYIMAGRDVLDLEEKLRERLS